MSEALCESIYGVVLAGGKGRRIGGNKAFIQLGDEALIARACRILAGVFSDVMIVADEVAPFSHLPYRCIPDRLPELGPIGGIESALRTFPQKGLFVVACDMPFLNPDVVRSMLALSCDYDLVIPRIAGRLHPLHAIYGPACLPVITAHIKKKDLVLHSLTSDLNCLFCEEDLFKALDPRFQSLVNINTPKDLAFAQSLETGA